MKVEIWSDFTCPFCYIAKKHLELALEKFEQRQFVRIEYKSFQLDKGVTIESSENIYSLLYKNYEVTYDRVEEMMLYLQEEAAAIDLKLSVAALSYANTWDAHRLVKYAEKQGKSAALIDLLYEHYFVLNENIGETNILLKIAQMLALDINEVAQLFELNKFERAIRNDSDLAEELGINSVPFFIINEKYALSGMQKSDYLLAALQQIWEEDKAAILARQKARKAGTGCCEGPDCTS